MVKKVLGPLWQVFDHFTKRCFTVFHPYERLAVSERFRGRVILNMERCVGCGVCAYICTNKAIEMVLYGEYSEAGTGRYPQLDLGRCMYCGFCVDYCPKLALTMSHEHESAEYSRAMLVYSPSRFSKQPKEPKGKRVTVKKWDRHGATHS